MGLGNVLVFLGRLIVAFVVGIIAMGVYDAIKKSKRGRTWVSILICSIVVGLVFSFAPIGKPRGAKIKLDTQPEKSGDTFIFSGKIVNYNPYRIVTYLEKLSDPGKLHLVSRDTLVVKWRIGSEGSWVIKIPRTKDMKSIYFFLVREKEPVQSHVPGPEKVICVHWTKWGF